MALIKPKQIEGGAGNGGGNTLSGAAIVTLPSGAGVYEHEEAVAVPGIVPGNTILAAFAASEDADENEAWMLDPAINPVATAGTDQITFELSFREKASGPIKLIWKVL